jgi:hypothetical protein
LHAERRTPGVTLELLHLEYLEQHPDGYRYTRFCEVYRRWLQRRGLSMRQVHRAGDTCFVDSAGKKPAIVDPTTGKVIPVELGVAALGASNYTYAEATRTQQVPDWLASHQRAFQFFGGVPTAVVCDQLKSGVVVPCRYEPSLNAANNDPFDSRDPKVDQPTTIGIGFDWASSVPTHVSAGHATAARRTSRRVERHVAFTPTLQRKPARVSLVFS